MDLVFYHRILRRFVLIDLKMGRISAEDAGQMLGYVGYYEREQTREGEGPPIGILLGASKNETAIRYALTGSAQKVFAARYQLHLPDEDDLLRQVNRTREDFLLERHLAQPLTAPGGIPDANGPDSDPLEADNGADAEGTVE